MKSAVLAMRKYKIPIATAAKELNGPRTSLIIWLKTNENDSVRLEDIKVHYHGGQKVNFMFLISQIRVY